MKCPNRNSVHFNRQLNDHEIEVCYFTPIKDQLQRILNGMQNKEMARNNLRLPLLAAVIGCL